MIALFNSGFRELYRLNVLNTLHISSGGVNIYRYSSREEHDYVDPTVKQLAKAEKLDEVPCMIIFVDRSDPEAFRFLPLRRGMVTSISAENQQYRFVVRLNEFIHVADPGGFTKSIMDLCGGDVPHLGAADKVVGHFAKALDDVARLDALTISDETSWAKTVDSLLVLPCFVDHAETIACTGNHDTGLDNCSAFC